MKRIIIILINLLFVFPCVMSQLYDKIQYVGNKKLSEDIISDIEIVIENFRQIDGGGKNEKFLLIDIVENDNSNEFYILATRYFFEIMFKRPDCYFKYNDTIVYMYTKDYIHVEDSTWLKKILTETSQVLGAPDFKVSWINDSIIEPIQGTGDVDNIIPAYRYHPFLYKYIIKNRKICSKEVIQKVYYPDNRKPKGMPVLRTWPNWPIDREAYYRGS